MIWPIIYPGNLIMEACSRVKVNAFSPSINECGFQEVQLYLRQIASLFFPFYPFHILGDVSIEWNQSSLSAPISFSYVDGIWAVD